MKKWDAKLVETYLIKEEVQQYIQTLPRLLLQRSLDLLSKN